MPSVAQLPVARVPYCVVDLETTGLSPGLDRVVELSVVRLSPGGEAQVVFDSLVDPERPMAGTEIHGITDDDVASAPTFEQVAPALLEAMDGAILVSYNISFDLRFLRFELGRLGYELELPHLCAMYARPLLGFGGRCTLERACEELGIEHLGGHTAAADAIAATELIQRYIVAMRELGVETFDDLRRHGTYKFLGSLDLELPRFPAAAAPVVGVSRATKSTEDRGRWRIREYQELVLVVLSDYVVTEDEAASARATARRLALSEAEIRAVHARVFASTLNQWAADDRIDPDERVRLQALHEGLRALGWAPGG